MAPGIPNQPLPVTPVEDDEAGWQPPSPEAPLPAPLPRIGEFIRIDPTTFEDED